MNDIVRARETELSAADEVKILLKRTRRASPSSSPRVLCDPPIPFHRTLHRIPPRDNPEEGALKDDTKFLV